MEAKSSYKAIVKKYATKNLVLITIYMWKSHTIGKQDMFIEPYVKIFNYRKTGMRCTTDLKFSYTVQLTIRKFNTKFISNHSTLFYYAVVEKFVMKIWC